MNRHAFAMRIFVGVTLIAACILGLAGCGGYTLRGKVVEGPVSGVELIHEIDQRLKGPGLSNAEVMVRRDPKSLNPHLAGKDRSAVAGDFAISISEFGAGWMDEQWLVQCGLPGRQNAEQLMKLPGKGSKWRLLITMAPGQAESLDQTADYMRDYEEFK